MFVMICQVFLMVKVHVTAEFIVCSGSVLDLR